MSARLCLRLSVLVGAIVVGIDAKGTAWGARSAGSRALPTSRAYVYGGAGMWLYTARGRSYSPRYGGWENTGGWSGGNGTCTGPNGTCPCPIPQEDKTGNWVWVQVRVNKLPCVYKEDAGCADGGPNGTDTVSFEVDAFREIASREPCRAPTQVLLLKLCSFDKESDIKGGLMDDQLADTRRCQVVGADSNSLTQARVRRLLQAPAKFHVMQFVVGALDASHGDHLHPFIKAALSLNSSRLKAVYDLPDNPVLSIETYRGETLPLGVIIFLIVLASLIGLCILFGLLVVCINVCDRSSCRCPRMSSSRSASKAAPTYAHRATMFSQPTPPQPELVVGQVCAPADVPPPVPLKRATNTPSAAHLQGAESCGPAQVELELDPKPFRRSSTIDSTEL